MPSQTLDAWLGIQYLVDYMDVVVMNNVGRLSSHGQRQSVCIGLIIGVHTH